MQSDIARATVCGVCELQWCLMMRDTQNKISPTSTRTSSDVFVGMGYFILRFLPCAASLHIQNYADSILFLVIQQWVDATWRAFCCVLSRCGEDLNAFLTYFLYCMIVWTVYGACTQTWVERSSGRVVSTLAIFVMVTCDVVLVSKGAWIFGFGCAWWRMVFDDNLTSLTL